MKEYLSFDGKVRIVRGNDGLPKILNDIEFKTPAEANEFINSLSDANKEAIHEKLQAIKQEPKTEMEKKIDFLMQQMNNESIKTQVKNKSIEKEDDSEEIKEPKKVLSTGVIVIGLFILGLIITLAVLVGMQLAK